MFACLAVLSAAAAAPVAAPPPDAPPEPPLEARLVDGSVLPVTVLDDPLELVTKYGTARVPVGCVRRIELATQVPADVAAAVRAAVGRLGHADPAARDKAEADLEAIGPRAYPAVAAAARDGDPEVAGRADRVAHDLRGRFPAADLEVRETDVVHTDDSVLAGKLTATAVRVRTMPFGDQLLRLADVREFPAAAPPPAAGPAADAPPNLTGFQGRVGATLGFRLTGATDGGAVWGTDVYTLDSAVAVAAVHAGAVAPGQTAVVKVRIVPPPPQFAGSDRNGVRSNGYGPYPAGAYVFLRPY